MGKNLKDPRVNFGIDFGGFSISRRDNAGRAASYSGHFHRLTPGQFSALLHQFDGTDERYLTTESGRDFRTAKINLGGLEVSIYSDVPADDFIPIEI